MASTGSGAAHELSLTRLYVLRAAYLLIGVAQGGQMLLALIDHEPGARGVIPSLLAAMCLLDLLGVRYPRQMLPLLLFEFAWKLLWMAAFGLPQYLSGQGPAATFGEDFPAIAFGVVLMPLIIPWPYVWRHYVKAPGDRWRNAAALPGAAA
jgi:hypothetical protein